MLKKVLVKLRNKLFLNAIRNIVREEQTALATAVNNHVDGLLNCRTEQLTSQQNNILGQLKNELTTIKNQNDSNRLLYEKHSLIAAQQASGILREIQLQTFELLKFLKTICKKNNLTFWIQGGTLLGAKRHQGFIPWDDDIDCGMMREDLEKLRNIIGDNQKYQLIDAYNFIPEINFACRMPKLVLKDRDYIFIDIFPYDYICIEDAKQEWTLYGQRKEKLTAELCSMNIHNPDCPIHDKKTLNESVSIINKYLPSKIDKKDATHIIWGIENLTSSFMRLYTVESFFPLKSLLFEDDLYPVPNDYNKYLFNQYGDIWRLPNAYRKLEHFEFNINEKEKINSLKKDRTIGYTAGAFDLFHIGHLNLLRKAKENCNYLIVGVTTDELIESTKGKKPFIPLQERIEILRAVEFVDEVVIQDDLDKFKAWEKYHFNILFSGDDWKGNERWLGYEKKLAEVGVKVQYFNYTNTTSSTQIQAIINSEIIR